MAFEINMSSSYSSLYLIVILTVIKRALFSTAKSIEAMATVPVRSLYKKKKRFISGTPKS
jgi:hypothetical protein